MDWVVDPFFDLAGVDATLPVNELVQRLGIRLVYCRAPHDAAPFAAGSFVDLGRVSGAPNDRGERVFPLRYIRPL
jgi:hypothetical protein